jgi:6-phosphogluconolactonase
MRTFLALQGVIAVLTVFVACLVAAGGACSGPHAAMKQSDSQTFVYVSLDSSESIAIYRMNPSTGSLDFLKKADLGGVAGSLAVDPTRSYLYATVRSKNSIASFRIDPASGDLQHLGIIRAAGNPVFLMTDKTGRFLFSAYFADSKAAVYRIGPNGALQDSAVQILNTEKNAHAMRSDPSNRFAYVPCRTGETIHQFRFDETSGRFSPNEPDRITTPASTGPRHLAFHPRLAVAYVVNEFGNSVTACHLDGTRGTLTPFQTLSTLPPNFTARSSGADVHLTPDGRFLYASNRGHESIAGYSVDQKSGELTGIGHFPTEKTPRSFAIDKDGRFLFAGGQGSGNIAAYRINPADGTLTQFAVYKAGRSPAWILMVTNKQND